MGRFKPNHIRYKWAALPLGRPKLNHVLKHIATQNYSLSSSSFSYKVEACDSIKIINKL